MKPFYRLSIPFAIALTLTACTTPQQMLQDMEGEAVNAALARGRFDLQCPGAEASVLSQELMQPIVFGGPERGLYTIGVAGCGQRTTYQIICPAGGSGCFAADTRGGAR